MIRGWQTAKDLVGTLNLVSDVNTLPDGRKVEVVDEKCRAWALSTGRARFYPMHRGTMSVSDGGISMRLPFRSDQRYL